MPIAEVYHQATINIIETTQSLSILLHCSSHMEQDTRSWVPDFSSANEHLASLIRSGFRRNHDSASQFSFKEEKQRLVVHGYFLDMVSEAIPPMHDPDFAIPSSQIDDFAATEEFSAWVRAIANLAYQNGPNKKYLGGSTITGALNSIFHLHTLSSAFLDPDHLVGMPYEDVVAGGSAAPDFFSLSIAAFTLHARVTALSAFRTEKGYLAIGDPGVAGGDVVAILHGVALPMILRRSEDSWRIVGPCLVAGIMEGDGLSLPEQTFELR